MTSFLLKFKSLAIGTMVLSFFVAVTMSSCGSTDKGSEDKENVEAQASESEEHPAEEGDEHPVAEGDEHPSDSTATAEGEHPEGEDEEHPSDDAEASAEEEK